MRGLLILITCCVCPTAAMAIGAADRHLSSGVRFAQAETPLPVPGTPEVIDPVPVAPEDGAMGEPDPGQEGPDDGEGSSPDDLSLGEIPVIETMELTPDIAQRALDIYLLVKTKYENADLESYEDLQDFVDQSTDGQNFEADIRAAGFASVNDWNLAITTVTFAYTSVTDDPSADILQQISEIEADTELAQDMRDRMVASLRAMIPSENNKQVIAGLMADPAHLEKLKQLDVEEE